MCSPGQIGRIGPTRISHHHSRVGTKNREKLFLLLGQQSGIEFWRFQRDESRHTSSIVVCCELAADERRPGVRRRSGIEPVSFFCVIILSGCIRSERNPYPSPSPSPGGRSFQAPERVPPLGRFSPRFDSALSPPLR